MSRVNPLSREISAKIVYYGPGLSGKTTNLQYIHRTIKPDRRGELVSLATEGDRTIFFDFLPVHLERVRGLQVRLQLYTVPGQVFYAATRKLVLNGADGVVFVADSQEAARDQNIASLRDLRENLLELGIELADFPFVLAYNKRDIPGVMPVERLEADLNAHGAPSFEACATEGPGVFDTLKAIVRLVVQDLKARQKAAESKAHAAFSLAGEEGPSGSVSAAASAAAQEEAESLAAQAPPPAAAAAPGTPAGSAPAVASWTAPEADEVEAPAEVVPSGPGSAVAAEVAASAAPAEPLETAEAPGPAESSAAAEAPAPSAPAGVPTWAQGLAAEDEDEAAGEPAFAEGFAAAESARSPEPAFSGQPTAGTAHPPRDATRDAARLAVLGAAADAGPAWSELTPEPEAPAAGWSSGGFPAEAARADAARLARIAAAEDHGVARRYASFAPLWEGDATQLMQVEALLRERAWAPAVREAARVLSEILDYLPGATEHDGPIARALLLGLDGRDYARFSRLASTPDEAVDEADALYALHVLLSARLKLLALLG